MTGAELSQVITSIATLVASVGAVLVGLRNGKRGEERSRETNEKVDDVHSVAKQVQVETNGMKTELVNEVRNASFAAGKKDQKEHPSA